MSTVAVPQITPGMTLAVEPRDYLYGAEMALLIVKSISVDQALLPSLEWVLIHCTRLRHDGAFREPEFAPLIRTSALAAAVRPTGWLPSLGGQDPGLEPDWAAPDRSGTGVRAQRRARHAGTDNPAEG